ncbi:Ser-Thr-rich glycosyl-phosphatidyl-inositol-anchored membrane family-domain-containing protein [Lineolata rhizophorae]|uniref:Ser-Thr-rich glycosyl-phosphatidyl-inositol-anchored membrane family-domain-containing protein n=1 Tax=Lineolata rhizophorae TaxID=578093 RepID=A0A6A6P332_9PEZI|nr:Ser-Thr-rich glycosyl-phosphatidyl-inositol-anchored membrane family-domain-containing protein [Lineolata rhizophorae]
MYSTDFSVFALFTAGLATLASGYTQPVGDSPSGNPIYKPGLDEIVPVGEPYEITWDPTTEGTVTLLLLRGPSENILPLYPIVEEVENTGTYSWTPSADLEPDTTHYGIQLICDSDGSYQYTSQFGISNPDYSGSSSSSSSSGVASSTTVASSSVAESSTSMSTSESSDTYVTEVVTAFTTFCPGPTSVVVNNFTYTVTESTMLTVTDCPCTVTHPAGTGSATPVVSYTASTGFPVNSSSILSPSRSMTIPSSLRTTASPTATSGGAEESESAPASPTDNAAGKLGLSAGLAGIALAALAM